MSSSPASAITSASPSFWQVIPHAPSSTWRAGESRHLVRLDVRPQTEIVFVTIGLHLRKIALHAIEIDHGDRRFQIPRRASDAPGQLGRTATQSISTWIPTSWLPTVVRAGGSRAKNSL